MEAILLNLVRDRLWIWGHQEGSHNGRYHLPGDSRMTVAEAAYYLDLPNALMMCFAGLPEPASFEQHALALSPLKRVVWSVVGDSSSTRNDEKSDVEEVAALAEKFPNIAGGMLDDFFIRPKEGEQKVCRHSLQNVARMSDRLHGAVRSLDLWVVMYKHHLGLPVAEYLDLCDVIAYWTWQASELVELEGEFDKFVALAPEKRKVLGCYFWDFSGGGRPIPLELMQHQCEVGLNWLKEGKIEGMIFLPSCVCDLRLETVEWTRDWIARVGGQELSAGAA